MNQVSSGILDFEVYPIADGLLKTGQGANGKGLFVACAGEESPEQRELLSKMLQAAKFDMAQDALVCWVPVSQPFSFSALRNEASFTSALFFGIAPKQAGFQLQLQPYQPHSVGDISYLFSASLAELIANPALKRPLWEGMRSMFGV